MKLQFSTFSSLFFISVCENTINISMKIKHEVIFLVFYGPQFKNILIQQRQEETNSWKQMKDSER